VPIRIAPQTSQNSRPICRYLALSGGGKGLISGVKPGNCVPFLLVEFRIIAFYNAAMGEQALQEFIATSHKMRPLGKAATSVFGFA
jgi:hypothetical protein